MRLCLELAEKAKCFVKSNPMVGAILVSKEGDILSQGYHKAFGKEHAEVLALKKWDKVPSDAILFVNLEPCCHQGANPPCTQVLIQKGVKSVVIGMPDPHVKVSGKGIKELKNNGIQVEVDVLREECEWFNQKYLVNITQKRALVGLKVAMSLDGKLALANGLSQWITGIEARKKAQSLRSDFDAVAVGHSTLNKDNPKLTNRNSGTINFGTTNFGTTNSGSTSSGSTSSGVIWQPHRVVFLAHGKLDESSHFVSDTHSKRFLFAGKKVSAAYLKSLEQQGFFVCRSPKIYPSCKEALNFLYSHNVYSVMVEGGAELIASFLKEKLADRLYLFLAPSLIGAEGKSWCGVLQLDELKQQPKLKIQKIKTYKEDILLEAQFIF